MACKRSGVRLSLPPPPNSRCYQREFFYALSDSPLDQRSSFVVFAHMDLDDLQYLHGNAFTGYQASVSKQYSHYHGLQVMSAGAVTVAYGVQQYELCGQWMWPTFPGPMISFAPSADPGWWDHQYVAFSGAQVQRWQAEGIFPTEPQCVDDMPHFVERFREAQAWLACRDLWNTRRGFNRIQGLLLELAEARAVPERRQAWLETVLAGLKPRASGTPSLEQLSGQTGMAPSTLRRRFKQAMGMSMSEHALSVRMAEACRLLADTDQSVGSIADELGYNDIYFFSRQFRTRIGLTPTAYRTSKQ